ncbi:hypothetical protein BDL97_05G135100 [Sphagnum fallax]|nr:hypothetical protein BDL97_05G135100 [Sphagnum fallax]
MIITSADVLHSWAIPSLGVKCDVVPGRLNQTSIFIKREGVYYGRLLSLLWLSRTWVRATQRAIAAISWLEQ